jgi:hypothetical protein
MKKLSLDGLRVDSFATSPAAGSARGTVLARNTGFTACPISYDGTCYVTCYMTCFETCEGCETDPFYCR